MIDDRADLLLEVPTSLCRTLEDLGSSTPVWTHPLLFPALWVCPCNFLHPLLKETLWSVQDGVFVCLPHLCLTVAYTTLDPQMDYALKDQVQRPSFKVIGEK